MYTVTSCCGNSNLDSNAPCKYSSRSNMNESQQSLSDSKDELSLDHATTQKIVWTERKAKRSFVYDVPQKVFIFSKFGVEIHKIIIKKN